MQFSNGEEVRILDGEYKGMVGIIGGIYPDGRNEVIFPDSEIEVLLPDSELELADSTAIPEATLRSELNIAIEGARSRGMSIPEIAAVFGDEMDKRI